MSSLILFVIFVLSVCYGFNSNGSIRVKVNYDYLPDYEIPKWVYKKVFSYNKMTSTGSSKLNEKRMQYVKNEDIYSSIYMDEDIDNHLNEHSQMYTMLKMQIE